MTSYFLPDKFSISKQEGVKWTHMAAGGEWAENISDTDTSSTVRGSTHLQLLVKASWSAQGRVEGMGSVRGPQDQQLTRVTLLEGQENE